MNVNERYLSEYPVFLETAPSRHCLDLSVKCQAYPLFLSMGRSIAEVIGSQVSRAQLETKRHPDSGT
jgi:hypothetical protein